MTRWLGANVAFRNKVEAAEAAAEVRCVTRLTQAIDQGDTASARWWLERRRPDDWKKREETAIVGKDGGPVQVKSDFDFNGFSAVFREVAAGRDDGPATPDTDGPDE
jgi:hypothetical protein